MRLLRQIALLALALALVVLAAACSDTGATGTTEPTATVEATATPSAQSADELYAYLEAEHGDEEWFETLEDVHKLRKLGSPVYELHFSGTTAEAQSPANTALAFLSSPNLHLTGWIEVWAEGRAFAGIGLGTPREVELPAAPTTVDELATWLDEVYGPASGGHVEDWYEAIDSIELGESAARTPVIRVETSLPLAGGRSEDQANVALIAIAQSSPTFASEIEVWYADEAGLLSGSTATYNPYVY